MEKIKTTPEIVKVQELQSLLQEKGIKSQIVENSSPYADASGICTYYSLLVNTENVETAKEIVSNFDKVSETPSDCLWCPNCGGENLSKSEIKRQFSSPWFLIMGILAIAVGAVEPLGPLFGWILLTGGALSVLQFFMGQTSEWYVCDDCGHKFKRY